MLSMQEINNIVEYYIKCLQISKTEAQGDELTLLDPTGAIFFCRSGPMETHTQMESSVRLE